jgi:hypothetical protein
MIHKEKQQQLNPGRCKRLVFLNSIIIIVSLGKPNSKLKICIKGRRIS